MGITRSRLLPNANRSSTRLPRLYEVHSGTPSKPQRSDQALCPKGSLRNLPAAENRLRNWGLRGVLCWYLKNFEEQLDR